MPHGAIDKVKLVSYEGTEVNKACCRQGKIEKEQDTLSIICAWYLLCPCQKSMFSAIINNQQAHIATFSRHVPLERILKLAQVSR